MLLICGWLASGAAAAEPVLWEVMEAGATALQPLMPARTRWERAPDSHAVDLLEPLPGGRVAVGLLNVANEGVPIPGPIEAWDARTGEPVWSLPRPWVQDGVWEVLDDEPLLVAGRGPAQSVLMSIDTATGESLWSTSSERSLVRLVGDAVVIWRRGHLEGLSRTSGSSLWKVPMQLPTQLRVAHGAIYVEGSDAVIAIDGRWGAEDWRIPGNWRVAPAADGVGVVLHDSNELRMVDGDGQVQWTWASTDGSRISAASAVEGRAVVVTSNNTDDRAAVLDQGEVVGSLSLQGRLASSLLGVHGIVALTTEDELVAFSATDATVAFRQALPGAMLGWGPADRPELPQSQPDVLIETDDQVLVVRERAGVATYNAAHFGAGQLAWSQMHASVGLDPLTVGGRFRALGDAMGLLEDPELARLAEGQIARRRIEFEAARRRSGASLGGRYYVRPFRRPGTDGTGAHGVTLVDVVSGERSDVVYGPLFQPVVDRGLDLPAVVVDGPNRQLIVASAAPTPQSWRRVDLGGAEVPGLSVRAIALSDLPFSTDTDLTSLDALYPPLEAGLSTSATPITATGPVTPEVLLSSGGGASPTVCVEQGILEADRPEVVETCLDLGIDLVSPLPDGRFALLLATERNRLEIVRKLLDAGADPNTTEPLDPRRPVERATHGDLMALLVGRGGLERSAKDKKRAIKDLLQLSGLRKPNAAWCFHHGSKGRTDVIEACLAKSSSGLLTYVDPDDGHLLHVAALAGRVEHVRLLLEAGGNANVVDAEGITPLGRLDTLPSLDDGQAKAARLLELAGGL